MTDSPLDLLETERRYVARELHDGVAQTMLQLGLQVGICRKMLERGKLEMLSRELTELEGRIDQAAGQVREMIGDMRPPEVEAEATLETYLGAILASHRERGGPPVEASLPPAGQYPAFPPAAELTLARIVQEALLNIRKHARATGVRFCLAESDGSVDLLIADNGPGFDPEGRGGKGGAGLANMQARAQLLGGTLSIARDAAGEWTEVRLTLPK